MAENKKLVEQITSMDEDFAKWYTDIVKKAKNRFVVVSAPGKRNSEDIKLTDCLINAFGASSQNKDFEPFFNVFKQQKAYGKFCRRLTFYFLNL